MPPGTKKVDRSTRWGNPHRYTKADKVFGLSRQRAVDAFRDALIKGALPVTAQDVRKHLRGYNLACWCPLDEPCHADVLLELANA